MPRSFFHDFIRDDGSPVTVEFEHGDYVMIVDVMPNTPDFDRLCGEQLCLTRTVYGGPIDLALMDTETRERLAELDAQMAAAKAACKLTDAEDNRMCAWLAEHHVVDYSDDIEF